MLEHYYGFSMYTAPGPPSNVKGLCTVVLWARPSQPNGKIRGYEVQIYIPNEWFGPVHPKRESDNYHIVEDSDRPSEYQHSQLFVGVSQVYTKHTIIACVNSLRFRKSSTSIIVCEHLGVCLITSSDVSNYCAGESSQPCWQRKLE